MTTFLVEKRGLSENIIISVKLYHFEQTKLSFDDFLMTTSKRESEKEKETQFMAQIREQMSGPEIS
jgi:hypothetical protein